MTQRRVLVSQTALPRDRSRHGLSARGHVHTLAARARLVGDLPGDGGRRRATARASAAATRDPAPSSGCDEAEGIVAAGKFDLALLRLLGARFEAASDPARGLARYPRGDRLDRRALPARRHDASWWPRNCSATTTATAIACELNAYRGADAVLTVSSNEARLLGDFLGPERIHDIPLAQTGRRSPSPFEDRNGIVFIGNFRHSPNGEAVEYLCRDVLPRLNPALLAAHPVDVVGSRLDTSRRRARRRTAQRQDGRLGPVRRALPRARAGLRRSAAARRGRQGEGRRVAGGRDAGRHDHDRSRGHRAPPRASTS